MHRRTSIVLTALILALLVLSVLVEALALPSFARSAATAFPEVSSLVVPAIIWGVFAIACWQVIGVMGIRLVLLPPDHGVDASVSGWVRVIVGCLLAFLALVVAAFVVLSIKGYATPGVMLGLIVSGIIAVFGVLSLVVFRGIRSTVRHPSPAN